MTVTTSLAANPRFSRRIYVPLPDKATRAALLRKALAVSSNCAYSNTSELPASCRFIAVPLRTAGCCNAGPSGSLCLHMMTKRGIPSCASPTCASLPWPHPQGVACSISEAEWGELADRCDKYSGRDLVAVCR